MAVPYLILFPFILAIHDVDQPATWLELVSIFLITSVALYIVYPIAYFLVGVWRLAILSELAALIIGYLLGMPFSILLSSAVLTLFEIAPFDVADAMERALPGFVGNGLIIAVLDQPIATGTVVGGLVVGWPFLRAIWRFRRLRRGLLRHGITLAFRPWRQPGFRAQMRGLSRLRVALALFLFFAGTIALQGVSAGIAGGFGADLTSRALSVVVSAAVTFGAFRGGHILMRDANRRAMQNLGQLLQGDQRRPVLFLRSFNDDHLQLRTRRKPMLWPLVRRRLGAEGSFEEALTIALANFGPVVAIGRPGETHLPVGAAREYVSDETWKQRVDELIGQAQLIVILIGDTPGLAWEATRLLAPDVRGRVLFVMPPVTDAEAARRWAIMREQIARTGGDPALLPASLDKALVCTLAGDAGGRVFTAIDRAQDHYELAFALAGHEAATGPLPKEAVRLVAGPRAA